MNILRGQVHDTLNCLMKTLINDLFTKAEAVQGKHEEENERIEKIKGRYCCLDTFLLHALFIL